MFPQRSLSCGYIATSSAATPQCPAVCTPSSVTCLWPAREIFTVRPVFGLAERQNIHTMSDWSLDWQRDRTFTPWSDQSLDWHRDRIFTPWSDRSLDWQGYRTFTPCQTGLGTGRDTEHSHHVRPVFGLAERIFTPWSDWSLAWQRDRTFTPWSNRSLAWDRHTYTEAMTEMNARRYIHTNPTLAHTRTLTHTCTHTHTLSHTDTHTY